MIKMCLASLVYFDKHSMTYIGLVLYVDSILVINFGFAERFLGVSVCLKPQIQKLIASLDISATALSGTVFSA